MAGIEVVASASGPTCPEFWGGSLAAAEGIASLAADCPPYPCCCSHSRVEVGRGPGGIGFTVVTPDPGGTCTGFAADLSLLVHAETVVTWPDGNAVLGPGSPRCSPAGADDGFPLTCTVPIHFVTEATGDPGIVVAGTAEITALSLQGVVQADTTVTNSETWDEADPAGLAAFKVSRSTSASSCGSWAESLAALGFMHGTLTYRLEIAGSRSFGYGASCGVRFTVSPGRPHAIVVGNCRKLLEQCWLDGAGCAFGESRSAVLAAGVHERAVPGGKLADGSARLIRTFAADVRHDGAVGGQDLAVDLAIVVGARGTNGWLPDVGADLGCPRPARIRRIPMQAVPEAVPRRSIRSRNEPAASKCNVSALGVPMAIRMIGPEQESVVMIHRIRSAAGRRGGIHRGPPVASRAISCARTVAGITLAWTGAASAVDRLVPQGYPTIQAAINAASPDDHVVVSPGTYHESINFGGRRITVRSTGGPEVTVIDASGLNRRVVQFTSGETDASVLDGFTIRGGNPVTGTLTGHGGGILCCWTSRPTILNCIVRDNIAELGGGIYICLNSSQTRMGNMSFCNNLCWSGYGFDIAQGFVNLGGVTACADCGCDPGPIVEWTAAAGGNGHWYQARMQAGWIGWTAARDDAIARGGQLVSIGTAAEQQFVLSLVRPYSVAHWIGLAQAAKAPEPGGAWSWIDASPLKYQNWGAGLPDNGNGNQHRGAMRLSGLWDDFREDGETYSNRLGIRGWVIEWSADCDGDGVVDYGQILDGTHIDADSDGVPDCCEGGGYCDPCPADVDGDGTIAAGDIALILVAWGTPGGGSPAADIDGDGTVGANDLSLVLGGWGPCPD